MSENFATVDLADLVFPNVLRVDYIRVYQRADSKNIGCDPPDFPTQAYINQYVHYALTEGLFLITFRCRYIEAYTNPNLTTWVDDFVSTEDNKD